MNCASLSTENNPSFSETLSSEERVKFTSKEWDDDAGLYYFNARWYDANSGRFTTEDPIRDGLNYYVYVGNNPVNRIDPDGKEMRVSKVAKNADNENVYKLSYVPTRGFTGVATTALGLIPGFSPLFSTGKRMAFGENIDNEISASTGIGHVSSVWSAVREVSAVGGKVGGVAGLLLSAVSLTLDTLSVVDSEEKADDNLDSMTYSTMLWDLDTYSTDKDNLIEDFQDRRDLIEDAIDNGDIDVNPDDFSDDGSLTVNSDTWDNLHDYHYR